MKGAKNENKVVKISIRQVMSFPLWTTKENKTYEANFTHIRILNPDQLNALQILRDKCHITVMGPEMRFVLKAGHIRFGTDKLTVHQVLLQTPHIPSPPQLFKSNV
jgi:hypothetical protein